MTTPPALGADRPATPAPASAAEAGAGTTGTRAIGPALRARTPGAAAPAPPAAAAGSAPARPAVSPARPAVAAVPPASALGSARTRPGVLPRRSPAAPTARAGALPADPASKALPGPPTRLRRLRAVLPEVAGFAAAGLAAYAVDLGVFAWLRTHGGLTPLTAKAVSSACACVVAYLGNRFGPYRAAAAGPRALLVFAALQAAGAAVQLSFLLVTHTLLGLTSPRADLLSGGVLGMAAATALRFWGTRTLAFRPRR